MNEIMRLKKKHSSITSNAVCEVINQHVSATDTYVQESELRLAEDKLRIEDLTRQLSTTREKLDNDNRLLDEKARELKIEKEKLQDLEREKLRIDKNNYDLQRKIQKLGVTKPNVTDQNILELGKQKLELYKQLTRIRWDFGALERETKGLVTDKKNYIRNFSYPKEMPSEEVSDLLWKEIELSTGKKLQDDQDEDDASLNTQ